MQNIQNKKYKEVEIIQKKPHIIKKVTHSQKLAYK